MALDTYANLQEAILRQAARPGDAYLQAAMPDLIALVESKLNYGTALAGIEVPPLRVRDMETRVIATMDEEYEDLPSDWLAMRSLKLLTTPVVTLDYRSPAQFESEAPGNLSAGRPRIYTTIGDQIRLGPPPGSTSYTAELIYYAKVPALVSAVGGVNWLLQKLPAAYLYGALVEIASMINAEARIPGWFAQFAGAVAAYQSQDVKARQSGGPLAVRTDTGNP